MRSLSFDDGDEAASRSYLRRADKSGDPRRRRAISLAVHFPDSSSRPNVITALSEADVAGETTIPLLNYRVMRGGEPTVYVCRNFACAMPVTTPDDMRPLLDDPATGDDTLAL